jgi:serine/threonine protein kinase
VPGRKPDEPTFTPQGREIYERLREATEGKYEIIRELGRGGMAVVFLGYQKSLDREVAIKVLLPLLGYDPEIVERFTREARTQGKLDHPNIIQVYEIYNEGGLTFFTVPFISGDSMRVFLRDNPQPPLEKVFRYLTQAADALAYAHRRGVVHRDVKPDNILVDKERDRVILTDFGIAKALSAEQTLTTPGDLLGTPQYMSPEQGEGRQDLDGRADQYSLGLIGYEMLAGHRPFRAENLAELMYMHRFEEPPSLEGVRPDAPSHLRETIHRAISKDRDERFPTMDAFLTALEGPWEVEIGEEDEEGRTEPMPPPGSEATTVRVPTPPGTPRPGPVDDTAPETAEPGPELEPTVKTPEPWEAAAEPTLKTPEPSAAPVGEPPADRAEPEAPVAPASTPPGQTPAEAAAEATPEAEPSLARLMGEARPRGVPRALMYGGGAAVVAVIAALIIFGPLGPTGEPEPAEPPPSQEPGAAVAEGQAASEQGTAPTTAEQRPGREDAPAAAAGAGDESLAAATPAAAGETGGAEPVVQTTPAAQPSEPPPDIGDSPQVPDGTPAQVRNAAEAAYRNRRGAVAAVGTEPLIPLDRRLAEADRLLLAGQHGDALASYSDLILEYGSMAAAAVPAQAAEAEQPEPTREERPQPAVDEALRAAAEDARSQMNSQRQSAVRAGAEGVLAAELRQLDASRREAQQALDEGRFEEARDRFQQLSDGYAGLATRSADEWQSRMRAANAEMLTIRDTVLALGAEQRQPDRLATIDATRGEAVSLAQSGRYAEAAPLFQQAGDAYAQLAADLEAALQAEAEAAAAAAAAQEPQPQPEEAPPVVEEPAAVPAEEVITGLIETFRQAFEQEDLERMAGEVYKAAQVPGTDAIFFRSAFFDRADNLRAQAEIRNLQIAQDGSTATADVKLNLTFTQSRMGTSGNQEVTLRMRFVLDAGGWRLERAEQRR